MAGTIDMQMMRYINLFSKVCRTETMNCFSYNNQIVYAVPASKISYAIGKDAVNVKKLRDILRRKIKVIAMPVEPTPESISKFVADIVSPVEFSKMEVKDGMATITAGRQSKAALIGRNRVREKELGEILKNNFGVVRVKIA